MKDIMIGVDLAKNVFQFHGASMTGQVKFRKKLSRPQFHKFMADHPPCVVILESCGGAHYWARQMMHLGHEVKLTAIIHEASVFGAASLFPATSVSEE